MSKILGSITMVLLLAALYIAYTNKQFYEFEISSTQQRKAELKVQEDRLQAAVEAYAATVKEREAVQAENVELTKNEADQKQANENFKMQIESKTRETASNQKQLDEVREKTARVGDIRDLASKMRATKLELEELAETIQNHEARLDQLTNDNRTTEGRIVSMKEMFEVIAQNKSLPTLQSRIRSIYPSWGFVTLSSGNDSGVVMNSMLDVVRDGATIAKLLVTSVERNSAAASIVPDSITQDITLMVGDQVVPARTEATAPATASLR
jgi:chemotaxis protein histidine kinase CheA